MTMSIPAFHVSTKSKVRGEGEILILSRVQVGNTGVFSIKISTSFDPAIDDYPTGIVSIKTDLSDGNNGTFKSTTIELINAHGKHNPTVFLAGQCSEELNDLKGCWHWLMIANNRTTQNDVRSVDIVSFAIHNRNGNRINYGTGSFKSGDIQVSPA
jgi:hypothetical protein